MTCETALRVTAELPVRGEVRSVAVNGAAVTPRFVADVGAARLVLDSAQPAGSQRHTFVVKLGPEVEVDVPKRIVVGAAATCEVRGAQVRSWEERSGRVVATSSQPAAATLRASAVGRTTGFLRLSAGQAEWDEPVDLEVTPPWEVVERLSPALVNERAQVVSPCLELSSRALLVELRNNTPRRLSGTATALGCNAAVAVEPGATRQVRIDLNPAWSRLSPGTLPVTVILDGSTAHGEAVTWLLAAPPQRWSGAGRILPVDLSAAYNSDAGHVYGPAFAGGWTTPAAASGRSAPAATRPRRPRLRPAPLSHGATRMGLPAGAHLRPGAGDPARVRPAVGAAATAAPIRAAARPAVPHRADVACSRWQPPSRTRSCRAVRSSTLPPVPRRGAWKSSIC